MRSLSTTAPQRLPSLAIGIQLVTRVAPPDAATTPRTRSVESSSGHTAATPPRVGITACVASRDAEESAPHAETGKSVVDLRLGEQTLRFRDFADSAESGLVAGGCLVKCSLGGGHLQRRVQYYLARAVDHGGGAIPLGAKVVDELIFAGGFGSYVRGFDGFFCSKGRQV